VAGALPYILVDEYQDTNRAQYDLLRLLTGRSTICAWWATKTVNLSLRGADVSILLSFSRDFADAKVIKLEKNYRSTQQIWMPLER